jgi:tRNA-Thr(GGU) m(6)t(6)A37 methyltransferase TsaA
MGEFRVLSIGVIDKKADRIALRVRPAYQKALQGLDGFSHVWVLYWLHKNDISATRATLQVHPRGSSTNPLTGVFACRSPARPNPVALSLCRVQAVQDDRVLVDAIEAFDQTPILDLKPYISRIDAPVGAVRQPDWVGPDGVPRR